MHDLLVALDTELPKGSEVRPNAVTFTACHVQVPRLSVASEKETLTCHTYPLQVTLFSQRETRELMGRLMGALGRRKLSVLHVRGNPLSRTELGGAIDVSRYGAAICVLDQSWVRCVFRCLTSVLEGKLKHVGAVFEKTEALFKTSTVPFAEGPGISFSPGCLGPDIAVLYLRKWSNCGWQIDPDMVSSNGIEMGSQTDMLRLDALIMTVQLNLRKLLEVTRALHVILINVLLCPCSRKLLSVSDCVACA